MNHESAKKNFLYINSSFDRTYDPNYTYGNGTGSTSTSGTSGPAKGNNNDSGTKFKNSNI